MAHILNQAMNYYHCTSCNKTVMMRNGEKEVKVLCCKEDPTLHKIGKAPVKTVVSEKEIAGKPVEAPKAPAPQVTKLDVPLSGAGQKVAK